MIKVTADVFLMWNHLAMVGVFSMQQISRSLSFPECSMEVSPVREKGGRMWICVQIRDSNGRESLWKT